MSLTGWVEKHDPNFVALRRAARTAIVMPSMFAIGDKVIGNPTIATFAAFGSFALLLLVDFPGSIRNRLQLQVSLCIVGAAFVCVGTLANQYTALTVIAMFVVSFCVLFCGVVSSALAGASASLLLSFILPITFAGPVSSIPDRLCGWGLASGASLIAISLLWPAPAREPLRTSAIAACRAMAARLRADVSYLMNGPEAISEQEHEKVIKATDQAIVDLHRTFLGTPYRPTGLSTAARSVVRLVDEMKWLNVIVGQITPRPVGIGASNLPCPVRLAAAVVLEQCADLLASPGENSNALEAALIDLRKKLTEMETRATGQLPIDQLGNIADESVNDTEVDRVITALDPSFRAQELTFATEQIGSNVVLSSAADRRTPLDHVLGRQPGGLSNTFSFAQERAASHIDRHSVWLHNSLRGAAALGIAVLVAKLSGVAHSFWVVLGTLSVLRSSALNIGQNALKGVAGTTVGFAVGGVLVAVIGTNTDLLWALLPLAILIAGFAPTAISFGVGQAAFTVTLVILYNIIAPLGWHIGLVRVEDVALGCLISLCVGLLFWPRGAAAALGQALAMGYEESARYLSSAVAFAMNQCDPDAPQDVAPSAEAVRAASASRRLDDTFRGYLAERGAKPLPLAEMTSLITGPSALRLAGDAVLDLWGRERGMTGDRASARQEIMSIAHQVEHWYDDFATSLVSIGDVPPPLVHDFASNRRLLDAVGHDLVAEDGTATSVAVRMIWTNDHLDSARRLQRLLVGPAVVASQCRALSPSKKWWQLALN